MIVQLHATVITAHCNCLRASTATELSAIKCTDQHFEFNIYAKRAKYFARNNRPFSISLKSRHCCLYDILLMPALLLLLPLSTLADNVAAVCCYRVSFFPYYTTRKQAHRVIVYIEFVNVITISNICLFVTIYLLYWTVAADYWGPPVPVQLLICCCCFYCKLRV